MGDEICETNTVDMERESCYIQMVAVSHSWTFFSYVDLRFQSTTIFELPKNVHTAYILIAVISFCLGTVISLSYSSAFQVMTSQSTIESGKYE